MGSFSTSLQIHIILLQYQPLFFVFSYIFSTSLTSSHSTILFPRVVAYSFLNYCTFRFSLLILEALFTYSPFISTYFPNKLYRVLHVSSHSSHCPHIMNIFLYASLYQYQIYHWQLHSISISNHCSALIPIFCNTYYSCAIRFWYRTLRLSPGSKTHKLQSLSTLSSPSNTQSISITYPI